MVNIWEVCEFTEGWVSVTWLKKGVSGKKKGKHMNAVEKTKRMRLGLWPGTIPLARHALQHCLLKLRASTLYFKTELFTGFGQQKLHPRKIVVTKLSLFSHL